MYVYLSREAATVRVKRLFAVLVFNIEILFLMKHLLCYISGTSLAQQQQQTNISDDDFDFFITPIKYKTRPKKH